MSNLTVLEDLFTKGQIALTRSALFDLDPPALPPETGWERIEGMMLGLAMGDALGNTSESMTPADRHGLYGEIRDYLPNRYCQWQSRGLPSDDSQLAFWTLDQLNQDGGLDPDRLAQRFCRGQIFGIGRTMRGFIRAYKDQGRPWSSAGQSSGGNGALMRIVPVLIPHVRQPSRALWADAALAAMMTHNDRASTSACVAFIALLWDVLAMREPPPPEWWIQRYVAVARDLEGDETAYQFDSPHFAHYQGPLWRFVEIEVSQAWREDRSTQEACDRWYSGAYVLETVPSVLYVLMRHAADPEEAIVRAVNDTWDNDTVGAIVGAAVGALHGRDWLPHRWRTGLTGRTSVDDDGRMFAILAEARQRWGQVIPGEP